MRRTLALLALCAASAAPALPDWPALTGAAPMSHPSAYTDALTQRQLAISDLAPDARITRCVPRRLPPNYGAAQLREDLEPQLDGEAQTRALRDGGDAEVWTVGDAPFFVASLLGVDRRPAQTSYVVVLMCRAN